MKLRPLALVLVLATAFSLAACAPRLPDVTFPSEPTLPSFPAEKTPLEILTAAAEKTENDGNVTATYGRITDGQEEILDSFEDFITNPDFLRDFCALPVTATPSNTGVIRYSLTALTRDRLYGLLHGESIGSESSIYKNALTEECSLAIEVDTEGYLTRIEYTVAVYRADDTLSGNETTYLQLSRASDS